jgi:disulfide bond formation protein DsbB
MNPTSRLLLAAIAAVSFAFVAAGLFIGELLNLHPCPMCIFQRVMFMTLGLFAALAAVAPAGWRLPPLLLAVVSGLGGMATAIRQSWMQANPGAVMECGYTEPNLMERLVDWLGQLGELGEYLFLATGLCSSKEWEFLGLSMANWSIACFASLIAGLVWSTRAAPQSPDAL